VALTWGGTAATTATLNAVLAFGATARACLITAWYYPTTLTAGRKLFGAGATWGAEVDTTTDELRLRTDNTTDGQWTTTGVDMAVNEWKFIAIMNSTLNTGPAGAWRVWVGTAESAPVEATVTVATSPVGNFTGSTTLSIGNSGAATVAWQGDIESMYAVTTSQTAGVTTNPFSVAAYGAITNAEAQLALERYVRPLWLGDRPTLFGATLGTVTYDIPLVGISATQDVASLNISSAATTRTALSNPGSVPASDRGGPRPNLGPTQTGSPQPVRR
jgi:hypothetical protein